MKHPSRLFFCVQRINEDTPIEEKPKLFSVKPFSLSEERASFCSGVIHQTTPFLWEVESPSTFRDAHYLTDEPSAKMTGKTVRTFIRWRLRSYLRTNAVEVTVRKSPFDRACWLFKQEKPCWAEPGPQATQLRTKLMRAIHELNHFHPALAATVKEFFKEDTEYTLRVIEAAVRGLESFEHDPTTDPATYTTAITPEAKVAEPTPEAIMSKIMEGSIDAIGVAEPESEVIEKRLAEDCEKAGTLQVQGHSEMSGT
jgi:hypothetical protein